MTNNSNTIIILKHNVPSGDVTLEDFEIKKNQPIPTKESLKNGQILIQLLYIGCDPYLRTRISRPEKVITVGCQPGEPMNSFAVAKVVASKNVEFKVGDKVIGPELPWQTFSIMDIDGLCKIPEDSKVDVMQYVGVLSMPSFTAYIGVLVVGEAKKGETILISAASGAVGQIAVQIAKARGLRVVGIAGSEEKVDYVKKLGADDVFNYKTCGDYGKAIAKACPKGVDIYFDNVGGAILDAVLPHLNEMGRVAECGMISQYNKKPEDVYGLKNLNQLIYKHASIKGFFVGKYFNTKIERDFANEVTDLFESGKIKYKIDIVEGIENTPKALLDLFNGSNFGRRIVKV